MKASAHSSTAFFVFRGWLLVSAFLSFLGWTLALTGHLHARGYRAGFVLGGLLFAIWVRRDAGISRRFGLRKGWRRRWRRPLPIVFATSLALVAVGAALHAPNNYDALTYRLPQILHWLAEGRWHWIPSSDIHVNISPPGHGWLMTPTIVFFKTDRLLALPNLVAFALLPGLFFTVLRQSGVRGRIAWSWMWILPSASCFAMQAGGLGNDLLAGAYALASLALGLRASRRGDIQDFWLSALAAALVTGVKITAAPLALPWLVATLPCWRLVRTHWIGTVTTAVVALMISNLPTAIANTRHTGSWSGDPNNRLNVQVNSPLHAVVGNSLMILGGALEPPVCPAMNSVKASFRAFDQTSFGSWIREKYPRFGLNWTELATEENSGLGLGLFALAVLPIGLGWRRGKQLPTRGWDWGRWLGLASSIALCAYLIKMGSESAPRLAAPYYPLLLIPLLRAGGQEWLFRQRWWRTLAVLAAASVLPAVILTPSRPLWPAKSILTRLAAERPDSAIIARARLVYEVYAQRPEVAPALKPLLPRDGRVVGYARAGNDLEAPLWKPYGSRRIVEILPPTPAVAGLEHSVVIGASAGFEEQFKLTPEGFAQAVRGRIVGRTNLTTKVAIGPREWVVIALP